MTSHSSRSGRYSRLTVRKYTAIIIPLLLLYIYLLFFAVKSSSREQFLKSKKQNGDYKISMRSDWQNVQHPRYNFSVYSAYSIETEGAASSSPQVFVITSYRTFEAEPVKCRFYFENDNDDEDKNKKEETSVAVPGHIEVMSGWDFRFAGNFIKCAMPIETDDINDISDHPMKKPSSVSILIGNQTESVNRIQIQYQTVPFENVEESEKSYKFQFSVCAPPMHDYNQVFHFLEWFEFHRMMGVQQFTFYNMSIGPQLSCVMKQLQADSHHGVTVNIDPWQQYPVQDFSIVRYGHGLSGASNDCLLRHKGVSKYLMMVDVDEFIMPRKDTGLTNYNDLMEFLDAQNASAKYGEYLFKNGFFERNREKDALLVDRCSYLRSNSFDFHVCQELFMMQFVKRENWDDSTKYIVRPERVNTAGYHYVTKMETGGFESNRVSEDFAFSRHYRYFNEGPKVAVDKIPRQFGVKLARNVAQSVEYFMEKCEMTLMDVFKDK